MNKYDLTKISEGSNPHIYIGALTDLEFIDRRTYGFLWDNTTYQLIKTSRTELLFDIKILQLLATLEVLRIIEEFALRFTGYNFEYYIYIENSDSYRLLHKIDEVYDAPAHKLRNEILIKQALLERSGIFIEFLQGETNLKLLDHLKKTVTNYEITDDFQNETLLLSTVSSAYLDDALYQYLENNKKTDMLIQYIGDDVKGTQGAIKRIITLEDETCMNDVLQNIKELIPPFPFTQNHINNKIRKMAMTIRDSDLCLLFTSCFGQENFTFPDSYYYNVAKAYQKKIYVYDTDTTQWYRKSTSDKRELVKQRKFNIYEYKNISYYCKPTLVTNILGQLYKLIEN